MMVFSGVWALTAVAASFVPHHIQGQATFVSVDASGDPFPKSTCPCIEA